MHHRILSNIGINSSSVKLPSDLEGIDGLIIPGGESTTISLLIDSFKLRNRKSDSEWESYFWSGRNVMY